MGKTRKLNVKIGTAHAKLPKDGSNCLFCKKEIESDMYVLCTDRFGMSERNYSDTNNRWCEECFNRLGNMRGKQVN